MNHRLAAKAVFAALVFTPSTAALSQPAAEPAAATEANAQDIVVVARRSGAPMWEVKRGGSTVLLVGEIVEVPKATPWFPQQLEAATKQANSVILGAKVSVSVGVIFKAMFKGGSIMNLPKGKTSGDYLSADQERRLEALEKLYDKSYQRSNFFLSGYMLMRGGLKFQKETVDDASDVVRRMADKAGVAVRPVGTLKGGDLLNSLLAAPPESHIGCIDAAMTAAEAGRDIIEERGRAWTAFDIPSVMASPLETALGSCWPWTDTRFGPELRAQWRGEIDAVLQKPGVTLAVVPLRILAEDGGVLDTLKAQQLTIKGPVWRTPPAKAAPAPVAKTPAP